MEKLFNKVKVSFTKYRPLFTSKKGLRKTQQ